MRATLPLKPGHLLELRHVTGVGQTQSASVTMHYLVAGQPAAQGGCSAAQAGDLIRAIRSGQDVEFSDPSAPELAPAVEFRRGQFSLEVFGQRDCIGELPLELFCQTLHHLLGRPPQPYDTLPSLGAPLHVHP